jgi:type I restriction enzyme, S subunit
LINKYFKSRKGAVPLTRFRTENGNIFPTWEEKEFSKVYIFQITNSYSRDLLNYEAGSVRNIHYGDIHTKFKCNFCLDAEDVPFINRNVDLSRISDDSYCKIGDLVIADASEDYTDIGKCIEIRNLAGKRTLAGLHTFIARPNEGLMAPGFGGYLMQSRGMRLKIMTIAQGTKVLGISKPQLSLLLIPLPYLEEQRKIADFLTAVDERIGQLNQKEALLNDYKKGVMQQLFAQDIRFIDDSGNDFPDWVESEFELVAEKSKSKYNPNKSNEEWPCVELESLSQNTGNLLETFSSSGQKSTKNKFSSGEVLFGKLRPYLRKFLHAKFDGVCSSEIWVFRGKAVTNAYLYQLIQTHKFNQAANVSSGSKMPRTEWDFLLSVPFKHPSSPDEQTKIADLLSAVDHKIESVTAQITEIQTFKKGLLQQMFV